MRWLSSALLVPVTWVLGDRLAGDWFLARALSGNGISGRTHVGKHGGGLREKDTPVSLARPAFAESVEVRPKHVRRCPPEMVAVGDFCIDRFEIRTVDRRTSEPLSPYYPPEPRLVASIFDTWQLERQRVGLGAARELPLPELPWVQRTRSDYAPRAVSEPAVIPQGYLSYWSAKKACENAGKRLCSELEWVTACKGQAGSKFPYGPSYDPNACNVYRAVHPATALHGAAFYGHRDPRLNLVSDPTGAPLLRATGASPSCKSRFGDDAVYDMVGNLDEWVEATPSPTDSSSAEPEQNVRPQAGRAGGVRGRAAHGKRMSSRQRENGASSGSDAPSGPSGAFLGGFYARATREGCEARVGSHAPAYYDYSTGARCCRAQENLAATAGRPTMATE